MSSSLALRRFHNMLYGTEPVGSFAEIRYVRRHRGGMGQTFFDVREVAQWARAIERLAQTDVYIGVIPRVARRGDRGAVVRAHCLWADVDGAESLERARAFRPLPSVVVASGSPDCRHLYWPLLDAVGPNEAEIGNRRIAHAIGADMKSTDAARILRAPGTFNFKHSPPRPVEIVRGTDDVFTFDQVVGDLEDPPARGGRRPWPAPSSDGENVGDQDAAVTLIERYAPESQLWASGSGRLHGRCPFDFHEDRNPSFGLFPDGGYVCSCGSGDLVRLFVQLRGEAFRDSELPTYRRELQDELGLVGAP